MQTFQQYFYENKTILSHIMESRSRKWDIFIKFASSFEVLSFSIRFFAKFGRHFVSYLFGKPLAYRKRAAGIVGDARMAYFWPALQTKLNLRLSPSAKSAKKSLFWIPNLVPGSEYAS